MKPQASRPRLEVNLEELDGIIDSGMHAPLSEADGQKLKGALHAMAERLVRQRTTEKTSAVLNQPRAAAQNTDPENGKPQPGHGRNGADKFTGARKVEVRHETLKPGDRCPECGIGKVYRQREPKTLVRVVGQAPLEATVFEMERLRCNGCGQVFTAKEPPGVRAEKYDETAAAMIAHLRYGAGVPFNRLERLEGNLGIPLPVATQWEVVEAAAELLRPAYDELFLQAAQGEILHNDDTSMRILRLAREPSDERTGLFTSGIVSTGPGWRIALFFTGPKHAGENLETVLKRRASGLAPVIQMCDGLSRNIPRLPDGVKLLLANCLAHGRRQFVEVTSDFPEECRYVLEMLGSVYHNDALARELGLSPEDRLRSHQAHSGPVMKQLHDWMQAQLDAHKTEPNSGLGQALLYMLRRWEPLTLFLRQANAPLDNNLVERALKKAILHRRNSLFYKTLNGAAVGDLFMTIIHTCELNGIDPFHYLAELQRHSAELAAGPARWMPWNYRQTVARLKDAVAA